jgi:hypothetical protein
MSDAPTQTVPLGEFRPSADSASAEEDPRPLRGYAALLATYLLGTTVALSLLRTKRGELKRLTIRDGIVLTLATQHLSRLIAKDSITAPIRAPFTRFVRATGEGEVDEEVIGVGLRHAVGELIACPYCLGQWVGSALLAGRIAAPNVTSAIATACAIARGSDFLQLAYDHLKSDG